MMHELSGQTSQPLMISEPEYQPITIDQPFDLPTISDWNLSHSPAFTTHVSQPESSNAPHPPKRKADTASNDQQPQKANKQTCQKCGDQDCLGGQAENTVKVFVKTVGKWNIVGITVNTLKKHVLLGGIFITRY